MQSERYAFISAHDKRHVGELAQAAHDAGYMIISLGRTAEIIEKDYEVPVIASESFVHQDDEYVVGPDVDKRERRELVGAYLAQHMCKNPIDLQIERIPAPGRRSIDLVYINLMPPTIDRATGERKSDKTGVLMLNAAADGNRTVLTEPGQLAPFIERLKNGQFSPDEEATERLLLADEAYRYLELYAARTRELGRAAVQAARWARIL